MSEIPRSKLPALQSVSFLLALNLPSDHFAAPTLILSGDHIKKGAVPETFVLWNILIYPIHTLPSAPILLHGNESPGEGTDFYHHLVSLNPHIKLLTNLYLSVGQICPFKIINCPLNIFSSPFPSPSLTLSALQSKIYESSDIGRLLDNAMP